MSATHAIDTWTEVETPENVTLTFQLAGPGSRIGAYLIDCALRVVVGYGVMWCASVLIPVLGQSLPIGFILLGLFILEWCYCGFFEGLWQGRTPGKWMFGLRVIKDAGYPIGIYDAMLRNLLRAADIFPGTYGVGLVCMGATKRMQRIGDLVARTIVIRDDRHRFARDTAAFSQLEPIPATECDGEYRVSERTLDVIEQLLWRRSQLPRRRVEEIAGILAEPVAQQLGYPLEKEPGDRNIYFLRRVLRTFSSIEEGQGP